MDTELFVLVRKRVFAYGLMDLGLFINLDVSDGVADAGAGTR